MLSKAIRSFTRPDGTKCINFNGIGGNNYGCTLAYDDTSQSGYPAQYPSAWEIMHSDGTHYRGGNNATNGGSAGYVYRKRPGESSYSQRFFSYGNSQHYSCAVEWNNELWIFSQNASNGYLNIYKENPANTTWTNYSQLNPLHFSAQINNNTNNAYVWDAFVHKNELFYVANQQMFKYSLSNNNFTQMSNLGTSGNTSIQSWYHDSNYLYVQTQFTSSSTPYWYRSNNLGVTWTPWWYGQPSSIDLGDFRSKKGCNFLEALGHSFWAGRESGGSYNYEIQYKETNRQTLTFASNSQLANINAGDYVRIVGTTDPKEYGYVRYVTVASNEMSININTSVAVGDQLETLATTGTQSSTKFLVIGATGNISGFQGADPGFVTQSTATDIDLTFPSTFASGNAPDDELAAGTVMQVTAKATNTSGSNTFNSNQVTPS